MMAAKLATPGPFKIKTFSNRRYDIVIHVHDVINKVLSRDSNYIVYVVM